MIKILVAEDQPLILKDLCKKIMTCSEDLIIVGEATNGRDAYEKIISLKPDIVFTDIRMPIMDGLELISKVKPLCKNTKFVIISGYKDFEFARAAMKLDVDEYLLKPITLEDIKFIIEQLKVKISMAHQQYEKHMIGTLLNSSNYNHPTLNVHMDYKQYFIVVLNAGPYSHFVVDYLNPFSHIWENIDIENIGLTALDSNEKIYSFNGKSLNEKVLFVALQTSTIKTLLTILSTIVEQGQLHHVHISTAISRPIFKIDNIAIESQVIRTVLQKNIIFNQPTTINCEYINQYLKNHHALISTEVEKKLVFSIQNHNKSQFLSNLSSLITHFESQSTTQYQIDKSLKHVISFFTQINHSVPYTGADLELEIDETLSNSHDYISLQEGILFIFDTFWDQYFKSEKIAQPSTTLIDNAQKYIVAHFSDTFTINDLATMSALTPAYFSRLFKEKFGVSPSEYVTQVRINKACEFILSSDYTFKEIADLCGYSDQFYFSKTFKSVMGTSPSQFKSMHKACSYNAQ